MCTPILAEGRQPREWALDWLRSLVLTELHAGDPSLGQPHPWPSQDLRARTSTDPALCPSKSSGPSLQSAGS